MNRTSAKDLANDGAFGGSRISETRVPPTSSRDSALDGCLDRLEVLLADEHIALEGLSPEGMRSLNARKSALLLELDRTMRGVKGGSLGSPAVERLKSLRLKLEGNLHRISLHLSAVNEIMSVVRRSVERSEADGTYSRTVRQDEWLL